MSMRRARRAAGFTLIEMIVTIAIFAILAALTVPTMRTWIANSKVRAVADALQNGVRLAQAESVRRSRQVVFALTNSTTPQSGFTASATGSYWAVAFVPAMTDGTETATFIQGGVLSTAGANVQITGPSAVTAICFNSVGRLVANASPGVTSATCTVPTGTPPVFSYEINTPGADHRLRVQVSLGGQVHLCDPSQALSSSPYGC